jgi:hypothetical protein
VLVRSLGLSNPMSTMVISHTLRFPRPSSTDKTLRYLSRDLCDANRLLLSAHCYLCVDASDVVGGGPMFCIVTLYSSTIRLYRNKVLEIRNNSCFDSRF